MMPHARSPHSNTAVSPPLCLEQQLPQGILVGKVVMDDIDQPVAVLHASEELGRRCPGRVDSLPLTPDAKGFFGPGAERNGLDHGRRDDLLAGEASPGHRVQTLLVGGLEVAGVVAGKIGDVLVLVELGLEALPVFI